MDCWLVSFFFRLKPANYLVHNFLVVSVDAKYRSKNNNDHWTEDEMIELVIGVSKRGIGRWSRVKDDYFSTSVHTAVHLKVQLHRLLAATCFQHGVYIC